MARIVIITHGHFGSELLRTAEGIVGPQPDATVIALEPQESLGGLCQRINLVVKEIDSPEGILVLTDMLGGTPCNACLPLCAELKMEIISGVNLYMLLSACMHAKTLSVEDLAKKVINDGKKNITNAKDTFIARLEK